MGNFLFKMKFVLLAATILAIVTGFEATEELSKKKCMWYLKHKIVPAIHKADTNNDGYVTERESWVWWRNTKLAPKWNAWWKKHHNKLSAAGKKAYWQKRRAFMKKMHKLHHKMWKKHVKHPKFHAIDYYKAWFKACLKYKGKK